MAGQPRTREKIERLVAEGDLARLERDEARKVARELLRIIEMKGDRVLGMPDWLKEKGDG